MTRPPSQDARWTWAAVVFIGVAAIVAFATFRQYGLTWDEEHSMTQGNWLWRWYRSGFTDRGAIEAGNFWFYGGFFNLPVQAAHKVTGFGLYETSHFFTVIFGVAGVAFACWTATMLFNPMAGFLAAVFLWLTPVYYGHSFNNPKDIPFATMTTAGLAAIVASWRHLPDVPRRVRIGAALAIGGAVAIRVGGVLTFGYLALAWAAWLAGRAYPFTEDRTRDARADARHLLLAGAKIAALAWVVVAMFWPYVLVSPIYGPFRALRAAARFPDFFGLVRFNGADVPSTHLPWTYVPVWFGVTLPEYYGVAAVAGIAVLWWNRHRLTRGFPEGRTVLISLVVLSAAFPVVSAIALRANLYDGIRHLLFIVPPMAILAGISVAALLGSDAGKWAKIAVVALLSISVASTAIDMVRLHPYESVYFNRTLGGGLRGAAGRFETDYWGQSYKEGVEWLVANYRPDTGVPIRVANCSDPFLTGYFLNAPDYISVKMLDRPDVVLATTRYSCHTTIKGRVLHIVERMGVPLCYVIEVDPPPSAAPVHGT